MSDLLYDVLVETRLRLERGIRDAQEELRAARARCAMLEGAIRTVRHQQLGQALEHPLMRETIVVLPDEPEEPEALTTHVDNAEDREGPEHLVVPTTYMPILEELWDIARRADSGT